MLFKVDTNFKVVSIIITLLVLLSIAISLMNYKVSLLSKEGELKNRSLPLTVDNIYTEIQRNIIEPNLVSSMMANDTFLQDWLQHDEDNAEKIQRYLEAVKNKYSVFVAFLVSEKTQSYYTHKGFLEKLSKDKADNQWYFRFKDGQHHHEINLDSNEHLDNNLIMFINHKIFDDSYHLLGATGVGLRLSYIDSMLKYFRQKFQFSVMFVDKSGKVLLAERAVNPLKKLSDIPVLKSKQDQILEEGSQVIEYRHQGSTFLLTSKYIPELHMHVIVQANLKDFTKSVERTFYVNLGISLLVTLLVALIMLRALNTYNQRLQHLASNDGLTGLKNRRSFNEEFKKQFALAKRMSSQIQLIFFDVDDFKRINDQFGHHTGDEVLKILANILKESFRETDIVARWGGEEFIIALNSTHLNEAKTLAEKLRTRIEEDLQLTKRVKNKVTISIGLTQTHAEDSHDSVFHRLDQAMYQAKENGKNQLVVIV